MKVDRYTKVVLTVIALALSALAINNIVAPQPAVAAAPAQGEGRDQVASWYGNGLDKVVVIDTKLGTVTYAGRLSGIWKGADDE